MERAIENLVRVVRLSTELEKMVKQYDLSEISMLKQKIKEMIERGVINGK